MHFTHYSLQRSQRVKAAALRVDNRIRECEGSDIWFSALISCSRTRIDWFLGASEFIEIHFLSFPPRWRYFHVDELLSYLTQNTQCQKQVDRIKILKKVFLLYICLKIRQLKLYKICNVKTYLTPEQFYVFNSTIRSSLDGYIPRLRRRSVFPEFWKYGIICQIPKAKKPSVKGSLVLLFMKTMLIACFGENQIAFVPLGSSAKALASRFCFVITVV